MSDNETIFSKIIRREIPADIVYEDEHVLGFRDISRRRPRMCCSSRKPRSPRSTICKPNMPNWSAA